MAHRLILSFAAVGLAGGVIALAQSARPAPAQGATPVELARIISDYERFDRAEDPLASGQEGDAAALARLPGVTPADNARRQAALEQFRERLRRIPERGLRPADRLNLAFLLRVVSERLEGLRFDDGRLGFTNEGGPEQLLGIRRRQHPDPLGGGRRRLSVAARCRREVHRGHDRQCPPRRRLRLRPVAGNDDGGAAAAQGAAGACRSAEAGGFMKPLADLPQSIPEAEQQALRDRARRIIETRIRPAQAAFAQVVETEVLPVAKPEVGALHLPGGSAYYAYLARLYHDHQAQPDQIHQMGLDEVARIRGEMEKDIEAAAGFKGTFPEFLHFLRTDPRFYATTREDLMEKSARIAKRADDELPKLFGTLPRLTYGVREVPHDIEENYTTARYDPGSPQLGIAGGLMVNTCHLDQRPLYEHPALMLHEGVPGPPSADRHPAGARRAAVVPPPGRGHRLRRRLGPLFASSSATTWRLPRPRTSASASCRWRCGAPAGWSPTPAFTGRAGHSKQARNCFYRKLGAGAEEHRERAAALHRLARAGPGLQDWRAEAARAAKRERKPSSGPASISAASTTPSCGAGRCRSTSSTARSATGSVSRPRSRSGDARQLVRTLGRRGSPTV